MSEVEAASTKFSMNGDCRTRFSKYFRSTLHELTYQGLLVLCKYRLGDFHHFDVVGVRLGRELRLVANLWCFWICQYTDRSQVREIMSPG